MANAVMACMRNEAMFVSEWVAYHLAIGFDQVFVCTNNCTDGTDAILDHLARLAPVYHIRNDDLGGLAPQRAGVLKVLAHPALAAAEWLLHIDADEFLNIHHGNGQVSDLLAHIDGFDAAAFTWRLFGDSHITAWEGGLVTERQTLCEARQYDFSAMHKTMFRPEMFASGIDHMPKDPRSPQVSLCNARGRELNPRALHDPRSSDHRMAFGQEINRRRHFGWEGAVINHYAVRTQDLFLLKNVRGDGIGSSFTNRYHLHSRWHRAANRNEVQDISIQRHLGQVREILRDFRRNRSVIAAELAAEEAVARMRARYLTPQNMAQWTNWAGAQRLALKQVA